jgi:hypothetical protein
MYHQEVSSQLLKLPLVTELIQMIDQYADSRCYITPAAIATDGEVIYLYEETSKTVSVCDQRGVLLETLHPQQTILANDSWGGILFSKTMVATCIPLKRTCMFYRDGSRSSFDYARMEVESVVSGKPSWNNPLLLDAAFHQQTGHFGKPGGKLRWVTISSKDRQTIIDCPSGVPFRYQEYSFDMVSGSANCFIALSLVNKKVLFSKLKEETGFDTPIEINLYF